MVITKGSDRYFAPLKHVLGRRYYMLLERYFVTFLILLSSFYLFFSFGLPLYATSGVIGAGFFPRIISTILFILVCYCFITMLRKKPEKQDEEVPQVLVKQMSGGQEGFHKDIIIKQCILIISLIVCIALTNVFGMLPVIGLFMFLMLTAVQKVPWAKSLTFSVAILIIMYVIFDWWLGLTLPKGMFE